MLVLTVEVLNYSLVFKNLCITPSSHTGKEKSCALDTLPSHTRGVPAPALRLTALPTPKGQLSKATNLLGCFSLLPTNLQGDCGGKHTLSIE